MIEGWILILVGVATIILRRSIMEERAAFNKHHFGAKFSPFDFKYGEALGIVVGTLFIIFGLLLVRGVVQLKG